MSQAIHENVDVTGPYVGTGRGDHQYPPHLAPSQEPRGTSNFVDGSGPIFSMYLEMATEEDKKMVEGWKADADGILIFTGLFSAVVASLISVSVPDIRPNPQDTSNFYLANIYQATLAGPASNTSSSLPASPPPFSPPNYAVWVNALLFLSLVISISCALLATLLQQWARRYLKVTQPRYSLHKRARIRAFFFEGVEKFLLPWAVEALPTLLHISLFLFFAGISVFLWNVNLTIFKSVASWIGICTALYGCITLVPIFRHDSPYHTPLSLPAWHIIAAISLVTFRVLQWFTISTLFCFPCLYIWSFLDRFANKAYNHFKFLEENYRKLLFQGMQKTMEKTALNSPSEIDTRTFLWTFDSLDEDHELERFFSGLPGFRSSKVVNDPLPLLTEEQKKKLWVALKGLFDRTFSSDLLPESVKNWRAIICARALDPAFFFYEYRRLMKSIMFKTQCMGLQTSKFGSIVRGWGNGGSQGTGLVTQAIVTNIIATSKQRDDSWFILASSELRVPESVLREYAANGKSLSLAVLIHVIRQQFDHFWKPFWPFMWFADVLEAASKFDVLDTSPELQHEFCALWNQVVLKAQKDDDRWMMFWTLVPIRSIYESLHHGTDSAPIYFSDEPSSYPLCAVLHHNPEFVPAISGPEALSSSPPSPLCVIESSTDVPPLDNFHHAHQSTIESLHIPVASPAPATASALQDTVNSGITTPGPTTETSTSPPLFPTSSPAAVALEQNLEPPTASHLPNLQPLASSSRVLDNILPTGAPLSSLSLTTPSYTSLSFPGSRHLTIAAAAAPTASPGPTSVPNIDAATEDASNQEPGLRDDKDALGPLSVNQAIYTNPIDLLSQPPSLPSVTDSDVVIAGPSIWEPNAEHPGGHPLDASHGQYNIV